MALKILLADDSMTAQNMGKKILSDAGYEVLTVSNGAAAVKKLAELTPDIAVLDVYMPGYSGLEVCERMKVTPTTARIPVLLTVGKMEPFRPEDGMKAKADGVIIKPFEATDLVTVIEKLALRTYGFTPAKPSAEQAPAPVAAPVDDEPLAAAAVHAQAVEEEPDSAPRCIVDEDSEPVFAADGLQTFEQPDVATSVAQEPHIEFTAAPQVEVAAERIAGLETTVLQDVIPAENATEDTLVSFGGDGQPDTGKLLGLGAGAFEAYDAMTGPVAEPGAEPVWEAVAEPVDLDAVDLEAEMRCAQGQVQPPAGMDSAAVSQTGEEQVEPRVMAAGVGVGSPAQGFEPGVPLRAPIGKTSFDELDSIMAETASRFEASSPSVMDVEQDVPSQVGIMQDSEPLAQIPTIPEEGTEFELEPSREGSETSVESAIDLSVRDAAFEPTSEKQDVAAIEDGALLAELISEEPEEPVFTPLPDAMRGSDALSGVFELEGPNAVEAAPTDVEESGVSTEVAAAEVAQETKPAGAVSGAEQAVAAEEQEPIWATIVPERVSKDLLLHQAAGPADTAADTQAANSVRVEEPGGVTSSESAVAVHQPVIALDEATMNTLVERVVDRVLERLKPILVVTVEEILKEFKR